MQTYGTNSVYAVMRILTMANIVRRSIDETQMRDLHDIAKAQKLTQDDMLRVVAEYEIDVAKTGDSGPFFNGDRSLPQVLVHGALNEIEGEAIQLQVSKIMHHLLTLSGSPHKDEVLFVENAVGHWGIGDSWRNWLLQEPASMAS
jgi:hypothetical protein